MRTDASWFCEMEVTMSDAPLLMIEASQVQALLAKGVPLSFDVIKFDEVYLVSVSAFETLARIDGKEMGLLVVDDAFAAASNPTDLMRIIKGVHAGTAENSVTPNPVRTEARPGRSFCRRC